VGLPKDIYAEVIVAFLCVLLGAVSGMLSDLKPIEKSSEDVNRSLNAIDPVEYRDFNHRGKLISKLG